MAFSKSHLYPRKEKTISHFAKAIAHPARVKILYQLAHGGPCFVEEIHKLHPISEPALSEHIRILRLAGLIIPKEEFPFTFYKVHFKNLSRAEDILIQFFKEM